MDFEKICMMFTMQEPFYGMVLSSMSRYPTTQIPTMGVRISGNTFALGYNPDFVQKNTPEAILQVLKHECLHVAFNHFANEKSMNIPSEDHNLLNIAEDMEVNCYIDRNKAKELDLIYPDKMGWESNLGTREYFKRLKSKKDEEEQSQQANEPDQPCNGGQGEEEDDSQQDNQSSNSTQQSTSSLQNINNSVEETSEQTNPGQASGQQLQERFEDKFNQFDDHSQWPSDEEVSEEMVTEMIDTMLDFAAQEVEKSCGKIPGEIAGRIQEIRKKPKPVTDWKRHFRRYLGNEFSELIRKSKKRESKRFPDAAGNRHRRKSHILVAIDTSGSVSMPEYNEFFGQIKTLTASADFHVVECDAAIQHEYDFRGKPNQTLHGGGGTDFQPVVDMYIKDRKKYDCLVYFTDGYCEIPNNTPKDTLWVVSSQGDKNRRKYQVNGASVVFIPEPKKK